MDEKMQKYADEMNDCCLYTLSNSRWTKENLGFDDNSFNFKKNYCYESFTGQKNELCENCRIHLLNLPQYVAAINTNQEKGEHRVSNIDEFYRKS